jgi:tetratricopeptide (TPR) repeat protein
MQAISEFERALKAEPIHPEALNSLAFACHWQAMRHKPNDLNPAESEVYVRSCERALAAWQTYLKHYSPTATIHFYLGELYQMQGNLEQTARHWEAALELNHWLPALRYNARLARLYEENKQFDRAEAVYRRCLAWDRGNPEKARRHALNAESDLIYFYTRAR